MFRNLFVGGVIGWIGAGSAPAQTTMPWTQLPLGTCGVDAYLQAHPDRDGRGVVIAVLDSGVDMGVAGLDRMPDGSPKVIDVQDFSGQGDIALSPAVYGATGGIIHYAEDGAPEEYTPPPVRADGARLWIGMLEEKAFRNSSVPDVNDNGRKDDRFGICVVVPAGGGDDEALAFVDADGDRSWANERELRNYRVRQDTFTFARPMKERQLPQLTCAVNVFPRERRVVVHFDDGGHGTHVAGIAAGWRINGQEGFNGIAPGAKVMSLKIGENRLAGGASTTGSKKRAFEYAARYAREHGVPVVCNLSYGIASEREGRSEIDKFLDKLCRESPELVVCTSAGNLGPGVSSVGTPAAASAVISCAALLAAETARDVMGAAVAGDVVTVFSSRGGEIDKPDVCAPGFATSTVPVWNRRGDFWSGTSMASPHVAGLAALLVCDARTERPGAGVRSSWVKAALQRSAAPVAGFTLLDFGAGCPNLPRAAEVLRSIVNGAANDSLFDYRITTECPSAVAGEGSAAYWRVPALPMDHTQVFKLTPEFAPTADAAARRDFTRRYALRSSAPWCRVEQEQIYFRSEQPAEVRVRYDLPQLQEPGLHVGFVDLLEGTTVIKRLWNSVAVPFRFDAPTHYRRTFSGRKAKGWVPDRYFLAVPTGATAMHIELRAVNDEFSTASVRALFRPNGTSIRTRSLYLDTREDRRTARWTVDEDLFPGVWEVCVTSRRSDEESTYDLSVRFDGVHARPDKIESWTHSPGRAPSGSVTLTNVFDVPLRATLSGAVEGYRRQEKVKVSPQADTAKIAVKFEPDVRAVRIRCETSEEEFGLFTDVAVNLLDPSGRAILSDGMGDRLLSAEAASPGGESSCNLEIRAGFTLPDSNDKAEFDVTVDYLYAEPVDIRVTRGEATECTLYPGVATPVDFKLSRTPPAAPSGAWPVGYVRATRSGERETAVEVPIEIRGD